MFCPMWMELAVVGGGSGTLLTSTIIGIGAYRQRHLPAKRAKALKTSLATTIRKARVLAAEAEQQADRAANANAHDNETLYRSLAAGHLQVFDMAQAEYRELIGADDGDKAKTSR